VCGRTRHNKATYVCNSCLTPFSTKRILDEHIPNCLRHPPQQVLYPNPHRPDECTLKFRANKKQFRLPFYLVADFESLLTPTEESDNDENRNVDDENDHRQMRILDEHDISGFCCLRVIEFKQHQTDPTVYSGPNVMQKFYEHVEAESKAISKIIGAPVDMIPLTRQELAEYKQATICASCDEPFTDNNRKVRHHCHISGQFLFAACNSCNLQLKMTPTTRKQSTKKRKSKKRQNLSLRNKLSYTDCANGDYDDDDDDDDNDDVDIDEAEEDYVENYFLPVVFHNLKGYDSHFVIKHFEKKYAERCNKDGTASYDDVCV